MKMILNEKNSLAKISASEFEQILESFFDNLNTEGTRKEYRIDLKEFFSICLQDIRHSGGLKRRHVISYRKHLEEKKKSPSTINKKLSSISSFCRFLAEEGLLDKDICYGVKRPESERSFYTGFLKAHEVTKIFDSIDKDKSTYTKYKAILSFGFYMGLRASSIASLRIGDFGYQDGLAVCRYNAKRKKTKSDPKLMHPVLIKALEAHKKWLKDLGKDIEDKNLLLFSKYRFNKEEPMTTEGIRYIFKRHFKKANLQTSDWTRYGSHVMRNTFSNELRRQNVPIQEISEALDHSSISVTQKSYIHEPKDIEKSPVTKISY